MPTRLRIAWDGDEVLKVETDAGQQTRLLRLRSPRARQGRGACKGFSVAAWEPIGGAAGDAIRRRTRQRRRRRPGDALKVVTTNLSEGWLRTQRRPLQRAHHPHRVLGSRRVSERRRLGWSSRSTSTIRSTSLSEYTTQLPLQARSRTARSGSPAPCRPLSGAGPCAISITSPQCLAVCVAAWPCPRPRTGAVGPRAAAHGGPRRLVDDVER